jgi:riboflavin synthase
MFTGLIEEVGEIVDARASDSGTQPRPQVASTQRRSVLQISAPGTAKKARRGDSIAVNGCCLTLTSRRGDRLTFDLLEETIARTNLKKLWRHDRVNLERALPADDFRLEVELPADFAQYVTHKGSTALDGISLTVADVFPKSFLVWIIPYTKRHTNLDRAQVGDLVNVEFDILAKYVEKALAIRG